MDFFGNIGKQLQQVANIGNLYEQIGSQLERGPGKELGKINSKKMQTGFKNIVKGMDQLGLDADKAYNTSVTDPMVEIGKNVYKAHDNFGVGFDKSIIQPTSELMSTMDEAQRKNIREPTIGAGIAAYGGPFAYRAAHEYDPTLADNPVFDMSKAQWSNLYHHYKSQGDALDHWGRILGKGMSGGQQTHDPYESEYERRARIQMEKGYA